MIIQFSHNGNELKLSRNSKLHGFHFRFDPVPANTGIRFWNDLDHHKRKFISHQGWYIDAAKKALPVKDQLWFWGEWEPQSVFDLAGHKSRPDLPSAIHFPLISTRGVGRHNTDPFVFGTHFYYTNCKQKQNGKGKKMLALTSNSIIIFGSEKDKSRFLIDTVFVVNKSETFKDYLKHKHLYPQTLRKATLDLSGGLQPWNTLYQGKMFDHSKSLEENMDATFCFVPCLLERQSILFEKPEIDITKFKLQKPGAGTVLHVVDYKSEQLFWNELVNEITEQGFHLGIQFDDVKDNDNIDVPEYKITVKKC